MTATTEVPAPAPPLVPRADARFRALRQSSLAVSVASVVVLLSVWELLGRRAPNKLSYPSEVAAAFGEMTFVTGDLLRGLGETMLGMFAGFAIAAVLGVSIGFAMGRIAPVGGLLEPYVNAMNATPRIALIPLLVLWFGIGFEMRVSVAVLSAFFPIVINTYVGASTVDRGLIDAGKSLNASGFQILRGVVLPGSLPYVVTGLRIGMFRALVGIIVAEMSASITGTGQLLLGFAQRLQVAELVAVIVTLGLMGVLLTRLFDVAMRQAMPWTRRQGA